MSIDDPKCNLCGETCLLAEYQGMKFMGGLIDQSVEGKYESTPGNGAGALDDMVRYTFSLCEFCLDWLFQQFKIPVATDDPMNDFVLNEDESVDDGLKRMGSVRLGSKTNNTPPWKPAKQRVEEDGWRKCKKEFFDEFERRNNLRGIK